MLATRYVSWACSRNTHADLFQATTSQTVSNDDSSAIDYPVVLNQGCKEVWSACGNVGILNINFRAALTGKGHGYFEGLNEALSFKWRKC